MLNPENTPIGRIAKIPSSGTGRFLERELAKAYTSL